MHEVTENPTGEAQSVIPGVCRALADLPDTAHMDGAALAAILGRCKKSVQRAVRRGELPAPMVFLGRQTWLVGTIRAHLEKMQAAALRAARAG